MHVLRAEKGYIIAGQEADGTATPDDLGLTWAIGKAKRDFVGKRSLTLPALAAAGRKQLVGLLTDDPRTVLEDGAQIVDDPKQPVPMRVLGHVTSSYQQRNARPFDRVGAAGERAGADGPASVRADGGSRDRRAGCFAGVL